MGILVRKKEKGRGRDGPPLLRAQAEGSSTAGCTTTLKGEPTMFTPSTLVETAKAPISVTLYLRRHSTMKKVNMR